MHKRITHNRCYAKFNDFCDAVLAREGYKVTLNLGNGLMILERKGTAP